MRKTCVSIAFALLPTLYFAQAGSSTRQVSTQENGVVVLESAGNEGFVATSPASTVQTRTLSDWNLAECTDALRFIDEKIAMLGDSEAELLRKKTYQEHKAAIQQHMITLSHPSK